MKKLLLAALLVTSYAHAESISLSCVETDNNFDPKGGGITTIDLYQTPSGLSMATFNDENYTIAWSKEEGGNILTAYSTLSGNRADANTTPHGVLLLKYFEKNEAFLVNAWDTNESDEQSNQTYYMCVFNR